MKYEDERIRRTQTEKTNSSHDPLVSVFCPFVSFHQFVFRSYNPNALTTGGSTV